MVAAVSVGMFIRMNVEQVQRICLTKETRGIVLELSRKIKQRPVKTLLGSGFTSSFVSVRACNSVKLKPKKKEKAEKLILADGCLK